MLHPRFLRLLPIISSVTFVGQYQMIQSSSISSLCTFLQPFDWAYWTGEKRIWLKYIIKCSTFFTPPLSALIYSYWCRHFLPGVAFNPHTLFLQRTTQHLELSICWTTLGRHGTYTPFHLLALEINYSNTIHSRRCNEMCYAVGKIRFPKNGEGLS